MTTLTLDHLLTIPLVDLCAYSSCALFELKNEAADQLTKAKTIAEHIDSALDTKYAQRAQILRLAAGKDTGVVHFDDGRVRITADLPKKIEWDQKQLTDIVRRITASGEDPKQYVEIKYRVSETKFNAWPEVFRSTFSPARTLKTGKPDFRLALTDSQGDQ